MKNKGISLIVLVMTILVVIVLASVTIITITKNNPLETANKAVFMNDLKELEQELAITVANRQLKDLTSDDEIRLTATGADVVNYIPSAKKYIGKIAIVEGDIIYIGEDTNEIEWAKEAGLLGPDSPVVMFYKNMNGK